MVVNLLSARHTLASSVAEDRDSKQSGGMGGNRPNLSLWGLLPGPWRTRARVQAENLQAYRATNTKKRKKKRDGRSPSSEPRSKPLTGPERAEAIGEPSHSTASPRPLSFALEDHNRESPTVVHADQILKEMKSAKRNGSKRTRPNQAAQIPGTRQIVDVKSNLTQTTTFREY